MQEWASPRRDSADVETRAPRRRKRVAGHFGTLRAEDPGTWAVLDAARDIETVRQDVERVALAAAAKCADAPVACLWD